MFSAWLSAGLGSSGIEGLETLATICSGKTPGESQEVVYWTSVVPAPTLVRVTSEICSEPMMEGPGSRGFVHCGWQNAGPRIDSVRFVSEGPVVTTDT